jgi:hypothetical protein
LFVSPFNRDVGLKAGFALFNISSSTIWNVSEDADWLEINPTGGSGNKILTANFTDNTLTSSRVATIKISGNEADPQYVTVTQNLEVSIDPILDYSKVSIFPNPIKDNLHIKFAQTNLTDVSIFVTDILGRIFFMADYKYIELEDEKILDLHSLKKGLYFLNIKNEKATINYKIIKE